MSIELLKQYTQKALASDPFAKEIICHICESIPAVRRIDAEIHGVEYHTISCDACEEKYVAIADAAKNNKGETIMTNVKSNVSEEKGAPVKNMLPEKKHVHQCSDCAKEISTKMANLSVGQYGKKLCWTSVDGGCQSKHVRIKKIPAKAPATKPVVKPEVKPVFTITAQQIIENIFSKPENAKMTFTVAQLREVLNTFAARNTVAVETPAAEVKQEEAPVVNAGRKCSVCRQPGHTKRNCPNLTIAASEASSVTGQDSKEPVVAEKGASEASAIDANMASLLAMTPPSEEDGETVTASLPQEELTKQETKEAPASVVVSSVVSAGYSTEAEAGVTATGEWAQYTFVHELPIAEGDSFFNVVMPENTIYIDRSYCTGGKTCAGCIGNEQGQAMAKMYVGALSQTVAVDAAPEKLDSATEELLTDVTKTAELSKEYTPEKDAAALNVAPSFTKAGGSAAALLGATKGLSLTDMINKGKQNLAGLKQDTLQ